MQIVYLLKYKVYYFEVLYLILNLSNQFDITKILLILKSRLLYCLVICLVQF